MKRGNVLKKSKYNQLDEERCSCQCNSDSEDEEHTLQGTEIETFNLVRGVRNSQESSYTLAENQKRIENQVQNQKRIENQVQNRKRIENRD